VVTIKNFHSTEGFQKFFFLQYSGPRPWYVLLHSPSDFENDLSCVVVKYGRPEGKKSLITVEGYSARWVQISTICSQQF